MNSIELWFKPQECGLTYKVTVTAKNATSEEILDLARMNWDFITRAGHIAVSSRP